MSKTLTGAGPYTWDLPALGAGEMWRIDFEQVEKGRYREDQPFDALLVKNYDVDNALLVEINGVYSLDIDPSGKDSYDQVGIRTLEVKNRGNTTIAEGDVTVTVKTDPYDADDRAREQKTEPPLRGVVRKFTGL